MKKVDYIKAIKEIKAVDIVNLAKNSVFNHHVNGMIYLCLFRSEQQTIKIYIADKKQNINSGYLVHPHNHRYLFYSTVLHGSLHHIRFKESDKHGKNMVKYKYDWKTKKITRLARTRLYVAQDDFCTVDSEYVVHTKELHTLKILEKTVIGLNQHQDSDENAYLYLPAVNGEFNTPDSYTPTPEQYYKKLKDVYKLLTGGEL